MLSSFRCSRFSSILNCSPQFSQITVSQGSSSHLADEANTFSELSPLAQLLTPECSFMVPTSIWGVQPNTPRKSGPGCGCSPSAEALKIQLWWQKVLSSPIQFPFFCNRENKLQGKRNPDPSYPFLPNSHTPFNSCSSSTPLSLETADGWQDRKKRYFWISSEHGNMFIVVYLC